MTENYLEIDPKQQYKELVWEIHLVTSSGDITALDGIQGMIVRKAELEKQFHISSDEQCQIFDNVTADSPYRR